KVALNNWTNFNGGYGYRRWTTLGGITHGGPYLEGIETNASGRQVDGNYSFGLYANGSPGSGSGIAVSRPLSNSITAGVFAITARWDLTGNGSNLFNLRSG